MLKMFGLGEGSAIHQDGAIGWGETIKAGQEEDASVDVSTATSDRIWLWLMRAWLISGKPF